MTTFASGWWDIPALAEKIHAFQSLKTEKGLCWLTLRWSVGHIYDSRDDELNKAAIDILGLQENALMVKGGDYTTGSARSTTKSWCCAELRSTG